MKPIAFSLAVSSLVCAGFASAAEPLTAAQMDGITAGSNLAAAALANAIGNSVTSSTSSSTLQTISARIDTQGGTLQQILGTAIASSAATADTKSAANAVAGGAVMGDEIVDSSSATEVLADSLTPTSSATATNSSIATSLVRGWHAEASSNSSAASTLNLALP